MSETDRHTDTLTATLCSPTGSEVLKAGSATNTGSFKALIHISDILVLKIILVLVFILFSSQNFYFI